jgi:hypothetical protein
MPDMKMQLIIEAINQTDAAFNALKNQIKSTEAETHGLSAASNAMTASFGKVAGAALGMVSIYAIIKGVKAAFNEVAEAVEGFNMAVVQSAAMITGMMEQDSRPLAERYQEAKTYATQLQLVLEQIDKETLLTARDLGNITAEMQKQNVLLDVTNQKQIEAFKSLSNAVAVVSAGYPAKEVQIRQEIRSLLSGQTRATDVLSGMLKAQVGDLEGQIALHKQQGDLIEWLGGQLQGFAAASGDIENTWEAVKTSMETIWRQVLRGAFTEPFREVVGLLKQMSEWFSEHKEQIQEGLGRAWNVIKSLVVSVWELFKTLSPLLQPVLIIAQSLVTAFEDIALRVIPGMVQAIADTFGKVKEFYDWLKSKTSGNEEGGDILTGHYRPKASTGDVTEADFQNTQRGLTVAPPKTKRIQTEEERKEAVSAAQAALKVRLEALKGEEKLEVERIDTRKALLDQEYQDALVGTEEYLQKKRDLEEEALRYSIGNAAKEIQAIQSAYDVVIAKQTDQGDRTKAAGDRDQKILAIRNEIALKEEKLIQSSIKGTTDLAKLRKDLAEIERDGILKALEEEKDLAEKRIQLEEKSATKSPAEAVKERYEWEKKILELKKDQLLEGMLAEGDERKWAKMYEEYVRILEKIANLPERQRIDTGIARIESEREAYETIKEYAQGYRLFQEEQLERLAKRMRQAGIDEVDIERWKTSELKKYALQRAQFVLENTDDLGQAVTARFGIMALQMRKEAQIWADGLAEAFEGGFQTINSVFFDALEGRMQSFTDYMKAFRTIVNRVLADIATELLKTTALKAMGFGNGGGGWESLLSFGLGLFGGGSSGGGMGAPDFSFGDNEFLTWQGRADGGPVRAKRPYWVGERGIPELFVPESNGTIIPQAALAGTGGQLNFTSMVNVGVPGLSKKQLSELHGEMEEAQVRVVERWVARNM